MKLVRMLHLYGHPQLTLSDPQFMNAYRSGVALTLLLLCSASYADIINIVSGPGNEESCLFWDGSGSTTLCTTQAIAAHPAWQSNDPSVGSQQLYGGVWVSYDDTGSPGTVLAPLSGTDPVMRLVETFTVTTAASLDFWIWADDTADLYFNLSGGGLSNVFPANFSQNICANGQIGCESNEYFNFQAALGPGTYDLTMDVYQVGTGQNSNVNPFGVLYSGRVTTQVPEPGSLALFGIGLVAAGLARRRRQKAA